MTKCAYLTQADEAVIITAEGEQQKVPVALCGWPDFNPQNFINAPRWLNKLVGAGLMINPDSDCVRCPGFCERIEP